MVITKEEKLQRIEVIKQVALMSIPNMSMTVRESTRFIENKIKSSFGEDSLNPIQAAMLSFQATRNTIQHIKISEFDMLTGKVTARGFVLYLIFTHEKYEVSIIDIVYGNTRLALVTFTDIMKANSPYAQCTGVVSI